VTALAEATELSAAAAALREPGGASARFDEPECARGGVVAHAPVIAGYAARILGKHPGLTPFQPKTVLHATADNA